MRHHRRIHDQSTKGSAAAAVAATAVLGALAGPASAATLHEVPAAHGVTAVSASSGANALKKQSVSPDFQGCAVSAFGYAGQKICSTQTYTHIVNGVSTEMFVIGTDWAVWHAWPGSGGWHECNG